MTSDVPNMRLAGQLRGFVSDAEVPVCRMAGVAWNRSLTADEQRRVHENADLFVGLVVSLSPAEEIAVTPAMIEAGREAMRRVSSVASDNYLSHEACNVYRAMERARGLA